MELTYQKVRDKSNIYCELALMRKTLYPYRIAILNNNCQPQNTRIHIKSKDIYKMLLAKYEQYLNNEHICTYLHCFGPKENQQRAFIQKIKFEKEIKLKEFNFKILHGILPCNQNLQKWKIKQSNMCDVCREPQTIEHLVYNCQYVNPLWNIINSAVTITVDFKHILGTEWPFEYNTLVAIVSYFIYKEWLLLSLHNKKRQLTLKTQFYINELRLRLNIYKLCKSIDSKHTDDLTKLLTMLTN